MSEIKPISALILAAGNSKRMGSDKASLPYGNGLTFAGQLIAFYLQSGCSPILMVVNERFDTTLYERAGVCFIVNKQVEKGRSFSIWLGLQNIPETHSCFIQNIDNPCSDTALLKEMFNAIRPDIYIVPVFGGRGGHPVLLGSRIIDELRKKSDIPNLRDALQEFNKIELQSSNDHINLNINTPEAYHKFIKRT
ncbi:MAG: nucleotidyltransferase family protein [Bacteroidales bacterium]